MRAFVILVMFSLLSGCFGTGLTHEERKGPDPLPIVGIFGVHTWWHANEHVTIRWYVINTGEETWEPFLFGGTAVSDMFFEATEPPGEGYRKLQFVPRQFYDPPVSPLSVVPFQFTFERPSDPTVHYLASISAGWSSGGELARTYCLTKTPPLDVRACALQRGATADIDKDERLLWPRLRNETGWLPPPVDVPEANCRIDAASVRCDYTMWNWDNSSATVDADVTVRIVSERGTNETWGHANLAQAESFEAYETRQANVNISLQAQPPPLEEGAHLEAVFRAWRSDLSNSVSESVFEARYA